MNLRVLASVSAATNCRYFFISVVWSTTVGLGAGTKAMVADGTDRAVVVGKVGRQQPAQISLWSHVHWRNERRGKKFVAVNLSKYITIISMFVEHLGKIQSWFEEVTVFDQRGFTSKPVTDSQTCLFEGALWWHRNKHQLAQFLYTPIAFVN